MGVISNPDITGFYKGNRGQYVEIGPEETSDLEAVLTSAASLASASNPFHIRLTPSTYTITDTLEIPSYTTLDLNDAILQGDAATLKSVIKNTGFDTLGSNTNITIKNGTIDWNNTNRVGSPADGKELLASKFYQTDHLTLKNLRCLDTRKFCILNHRGDHFVADNIYFDTDSDGIHCQNGGKIHYINNIRGTCGDDFVAYTMTDWESQEVNDYIEDFRSITVQNLFADETQLNLIKFIGGMSNNAYTNNSITDNGDGTYTVETSTDHEFEAGDYVRITGATSTTYNDKWLVDSVTTDTWTFSRATGLGNSTVHGNSQLQRFFDNITIDGVYGTGKDTVLKFGEDTTDANDINYSHYGSVVIKNIKMDRYDNVFCQILCDDLVTFDDLTIDIGGSLHIDASNLFIQYQGSAPDNVHIDNMFLSNCRFFGDVKGTGQVLTTRGTLNNLYVNNVRCETLGIFIAQTAGTWNEARVYLSNFSVESCNTGITVREELHVHLSGVSHNDNSNRLILCQDTAANGCALYAYGFCMDSGTDGRTVEDAGNAGTVHVRGFIEAVDGDVIAEAGAFFYGITSNEYKAYDGAANSVIN